MKFTHLHCHSHYSLLDGLPKIGDFLDQVKKLGMDSVALTDHGNIYGAIEFYKEAKKRDIKPIIGCEVYVAFEKMSQKRPSIDDKRYHLILLVKNEQGYKNLVKLITEAHLNGFYYKPRVDDELLAQHSEGLIASSACLQGQIPKLILAKKIKEAEDLAIKYRNMFGKGNFYLEIQNHPNIPDQLTVNQTIIEIAKKLDIPLVATNDSHYLAAEDAEAQDILMMINTGGDLNDPERLTLKGDDFSLKPSEQMIKDFKNTPEAIINTQKIVEQCNFDFKLGEIRLPHFEVPNGHTPDDHLRDLCLVGLKKRYPESREKEILERLDYELSVIKNMGFASYFLIVQDYVNWAKENRIVVGPGRGSVGGSVVSYCLGITNVDPIEYGLIFERFLNPSRISMPDIDMDFADRRRDELITYITQKYGQDKVAQIITFGTMAARAAVRDVGRALGYDYGLCDKIAKMIPSQFDLKETLEKIDEFKEIYDSDEKAKTIIDFAKKLEGTIRHASTHACGLVISNEPLNDLVPTQHPTQDDLHIVTQYEMHAIEDLGLLKMDILGLKNLTIIEDTLNRIYAIHNQNIDIENIPANDEAIYKLLRAGRTIGIFQLESSGMQRYLKQLKPTVFEDIVSMIALYRPGPMSLIPDYIQRKEKKTKIEYIHPSLEPILKNTYGIMVFQEQLMQIAQKLAGFSLAEADVLRKAVGKKIESLLVAQRDKFIDGAIKNNVKKEVALKVWDWILPFANYGFNKSHSVCYATIAYQTAYLKAHYPVEFMSALLTSEKADTERIGFLIDECKKMDIGVLAPDINESFRNFSVIPGVNKIRFGLLAIKNVGENIVDSIIAERKANGPYQSISDFIARIDCKVINKKSMESFIRAGVFDRFAERNQLLYSLDRILECSREKQKNVLSGQKSLFGGKNFNSDIVLDSAPPATKSEKLNWEKELLGLFVTSHPLESYKKILEKQTMRIAELDLSLSYNHYGQISIGGLISSVKKIITKNGKPMLFAKIEDLTDKIEIVVFPKIMEKNPNVFVENKIVFVRGKLDNRDGVRKIVCDYVEEIKEI